MSKYTIYYNDRQEQYRGLAKAVANMKLSGLQKRGMAIFFRSIAKRFGLTKEFKDIGVI
jgi:hypothetical protein